jgi:hypothetical protein
LAVCLDLQVAGAEGSAPGGPQRYDDQGRADHAHPHEALRVIMGTWISNGFGSLAKERLAVGAASLLIVGIQIFFSSFLLSILGLRRR